LQTSLKENTIILNSNKEDLLVLKKERAKLVEDAKTANVNIAVIKQENMEAKKRN